MGLTITFVLQSHILGNRNETTNACMTFRESRMKREIRCNERKQLTLGPVPAGRPVFLVTLTLRREGSRLCNFWERAFQEREQSWYI